MAQSKHTPGPWRMAPGYEQRGKWSGHLCIHKPNGGTIAMLPKGPHPDINEANARLIAAAPELLAALCDMAMAYGHPDNPDVQAWWEHRAEEAAEYGRNSDWYRNEMRARAAAAIAIAKAGGA